MLFVYAQGAHSIRTNRTNEATRGTENSLNYVQNLFYFFVVFFCSLSFVYITAAVCVIYLSLSLVQRSFASLSVLSARIMRVVNILSVNDQRNLLYCASARSSQRGKRIGNCQSSLAALIRSLFSVFTPTCVHVLSVVLCIVCIATPTIASLNAFSLFCGCSINGRHFNFSLRDFISLTVRLLALTVCVFFFYPVWSKISHTLFITHSLYIVSVNKNCIYTFWIRLMHSLDLSYSSFGTVWMGFVFKSRIILMPNIFQNRLNEY